MSAKKTKVRLEQRPTLPPSISVVGKQGGSAQEEVRRQPRPKQGSLGLVVVLLLATVAVVGLMSKGEEKGKEIPQSESISAPLPSLVETTAESSFGSTDVPMVQPTLVPYETWQTAITLYLFTEEGEGEARVAEAGARVAIEEYRKLNQLAAANQGSELLEQLKQIHPPYPEVFFQRYGDLASWLNPKVAERIQVEQARFKSETGELKRQESAPKTEPSQPEPEEESVEINLTPVTLSGLGIWISPENFQVAYKGIRRIPYESTWKVETVKKTSLLLFVNLYEMTFQRVGEGNPQTTWFKGIFVSSVDIKEGDIVSGEWLWKNLWEKLFS